MPIEIYWLVKNKVSYYRYIGDVTLEEVQIASDLGVALLEDTDDAQIIHTVQDGEQISSLTLNLREVNRISQPWQTHRKLGWLVSVAVLDPRIQLIVTIVAGIARARQHNTHTLDEAINFLRTVDPSLQHESLQMNQLSLYGRVDSGKNRSHPQ